MPKAETAFWLMLAFCVLSFFIGSIVGVMFLPSLKQLFGENGRYAAIVVALISSGVLFAFSHYVINSMSKN